MITDPVYEKYIKGLLDLAKNDFFPKYMGSKILYHQPKTFGRIQTQLIEISMMAIDYYYRNG